MAEKWSSGKIYFDPMKNYHKKQRYPIWINLLNLPNDKAINLYPSLCFLKELRFLWEEEQIAFPDLWFTMD
jgi:hypothetical protein